MRLLFDLMGAQTHGSRIRGIGRYTRELALAIARARDPRLDLRFALSANFPDAGAELRQLLSPYVPPDALSSYATPVASAASAPQNDPARRVGEAIVRRHVAGVRPDGLLASSLYEVAPEDFSYFDLARQPAPLTTCILYDLIPLRMPAQYLKWEAYRRVYREQTAVVASADLLFAISDSTRRDAIDLLGLDGDRIVNISGAADAVFTVCARTSDDIAATLMRLGVRDKFVFCVAGDDARKNLPAALDGFLLVPERERRGVQFVILAPLTPDRQGALLAKAARHGLGPGDIVFLARVDDEDLAFLYAHATLFLFPSLYEGFGLPLLEAMQCGAVVLAGDHSSLTEIADRADVLCDVRSPAAIAQALTRGLRDADWRADVRAWGPRRARAFSWAATAQRLQDALFDRGPALAQRRSSLPPAALLLPETLESDIAAILRDGRSPTLTPAIAADCIVSSVPAFYDGTQRRVLIDVTTIAASDRRTGIQRVVRNVVRAMYAARDLAIVPVAVRLEGGRLHTCQSFVGDLLRVPNTVTDAPIDIARGDCLVMLDNSWGAYDRFQPIFDAIHAADGTVVTCVYDLIPALYPAASFGDVPEVYRRWLHAALLASDGILTISRAVMDDLSAYVAGHAPRHRAGLRVGWFHCGSDIADDARTTPRAVRPLVTNVFAQHDPVFLIVGTLEPRKGHWVALDAFDALWKAGVPARLLLIGAKGWHVEALVARIRAHREYGTRLVWIDDATDAELGVAYARCTALVNPSYAEGFGLPLAEAARANTPVVCSDIPVFREIGGEGALYFRVNDAGNLAQRLRDLLDGRASCDPARVLQTTWDDAARRIVSVVADGDWSRTLDTPSSRNDS